MKIGYSYGIRLGLSFMITWLALGVGLVIAGTLVVQDIEIPVQRAIDTRQNLQKNLEKWEAQRAKLVAVHARLKAKNEQLTGAKKQLLKEWAGQKKTNDSMAAEYLEALRIQNELLPYLKNIASSMDDLIALDAPFLKRERTSRLTHLHRILDNPQVSAAEKYRKTMEALFVEAEYANSIEVYQEKIIIENSKVLGNIFRLGRVSLFFLSLDRGMAAVFNVARGEWTALDNSHVPAIALAVDMAAKHCPVEVIPLPIGCLAISKGDCNGKK